MSQIFETCINGLKCKYSTVPENLGYCGRVTPEDWWLRGGAIELECDSFIYIYIDGFLFMHKDVKI